MKLYAKLSKISFLKNRYVGKFLFIAFLGILLPIIALLFFVIYMKIYFAPLDLFLIALAMTAVGALIMTFILKSLMAPVLKASSALMNYGTNLTVPQLPAEYTDEAGAMLKNIQTLIQSNHKLITEKKELCHALTTDLRDQTLHTESIINTIFSQSTNDEVKKNAVMAVQSLKQQINFVDTYVELLVQEELINKQPIKVRKVNLQELFEEAALKRKAQLEDKNITLNYRITVSKMRLKVSNTLLLQALGYLIENAIKYAPEGTKIDLYSEKNRGKLLIQITDHGIGFEPGESEDLFSKFRLLNASKLDYAPGTGVYLASQIIERFGGTLTATSDGKNRGVRYSIELKMYR